MSFIVTFIFFFNDTATTEIYTLSLHDALPISRRRRAGSWPRQKPRTSNREIIFTSCPRRSEEHTSELQSRLHLVCRLLLEKKKLAIDSTVDIFTFYVPDRHVYGEQWIMFMKDGVNATPLPSVNTTGYIDLAAFLGTIIPDTNKIPMHLFQGYLNLYNNSFKAPWMPACTEANPT